MRERKERKKKRKRQIKIKESFKAYLFFCFFLLYLFFHCAFYYSIGSKLKLKNQTNKHKGRRRKCCATNSKLPLAFSPCRLNLRAFHHFEVFTCFCRYGCCCCCYCWSNNLQSQHTKAANSQQQNENSTKQIKPTYFELVKVWLAKRKEKSAKI